MKVVYGGLLIWCIWQGCVAGEFNVQVYQQEENSNCAICLDPLGNGAIITYQSIIDSFDKDAISPKDIMNELNKQDATLLYEFSCKHHRIHVGCRKNFNVHFCAECKAIDNYFFLYDAVKNGNVKQVKAYLENITDPKLNELHVAKTILQDLLEGYSSQRDMKMGTIFFVLGQLFDAPIASVIGLTLGGIGLKDDQKYQPYQEIYVMLKEKKQEIKQQIEIEQDCRASESELMD